MCVLRKGNSASGGQKHRLRAAQVFVLHPLFYDEMYALILVSFLSFAIGFLGYSCTYILDQIAAFSDQPSVVAPVLEAVLRVVSPTYLAFKLLFRVLSASKSEHLWGWRVAGQSLAWLALQGGIYLCLAVLRGVLWLGGGRRILVLTADHIAGALLFVLRPLWDGASWCARPFYVSARSVATPCSFCARPTAEGTVAAFTPKRWRSCAGASGRWGTACAPRTCPRRRRPPPRLRTSPRRSSTRITPCPRRSTPSACARRALRSTRTSQRQRPGTPTRPPARPRRARRPQATQRLRQCRALRSRLRGR